MPRDFDLAASHTLSLSLSFYPPVCLFSAFSFFPARAAETGSPQRRSRESRAYCSRATTGYNGTLGVVSLVLSLLRPHIVSHRRATSIRPLRPAADLPAAQRGEWATYRASLLPTYLLLPCASCLLLLIAKYEAPEISPISKRTYLGSHRDRSYVRESVPTPSPTDLCHDSRLLFHIHMISRSSV